MKINIITGDLLSVSCDAWVNPTDTRLSGSGGLDKVFHQKCGPRLEMELSGKGSLNPGEVAATSGCGLPVKYILHAAVPLKSSETGPTYDRLEKCCENIIMAANSKGSIRHLAMPLIGTGHGGYDLYDTFYPGSLISMTAAAILSGIIRGMHKAIHSPFGLLSQVTIVCSPEKNRIPMDSARSWMLGKGIDVRSRVRGCLLGGAIGDALGYPIEFMKPAEFPKSMQDWTAEYLLDPESGKAVISDDTQMTLFTACGLLYGYSRSCMKGIGGDIWYYIHMAYEDWLKTQDPNVSVKYPISWISSIPQLNVRRVPGNTCLSALYAGGGSIKKPANGSKGSGGVMRIAPIPLYAGANGHFDQKYNLRSCAETAAITHGHPLGWLSAAAMGNLLYDIMLNFSIFYAIQDTVLILEREFGNYPETRRLTALLKNAKILADTSSQTSSVNLIAEFDIMEQLGEGWVGEEALAVGLFCMMACMGRGTDLCLLNAVKHRGDSDTVGSIAGQLWGAYFGVQAFEWNEQLLSSLELKDVILEIADDLVNDCQMSEYGAYNDPAWSSKYLCGGSSGYQPGTDVHWYQTFSSEPVNSYSAVYKKTGAKDDGTEVVQNIPYEIRLEPDSSIQGVVGQYIFSHLSCDPDAAEAGKPGFGFVQSPQLHPRTNKYSCQHGWLRCHPDGSAEGYYMGLPFQLIPNRIEHSLEIFSRTSPDPWIGSIRRRTGDWNDPIEIELRQRPRRTFCEALALAAVNFCLKRSGI